MNHYLAVRSVSGTWHVWSADGGTRDDDREMAGTDCYRWVIISRLDEVPRGQYPGMTGRRESGYYRTMRDVFARDGRIEGIADPEAWLERIRYAPPALCCECRWPGEAADG